MDMYCPKCGGKMVPKNNSMFCERGNMLLSKTLYARFQSRFVEHTPEEPLLRRMSMPRGHFFCPACGTRMKFFGGNLACPNGHGALNDCIFDLNMMHAHDRPKSD